MARRAKMGHFDNEISKECVMHASLKNSCTRKRCESSNRNNSYGVNCMDPRNQLHAHHMLNPHKNSISQARAYDPRYVSEEVRVTSTLCLKCLKTKYSTTERELKKEHKRILRSRRKEAIRRLMVEYGINPKLKHRLRRQFLASGFRENLVSFTAAYMRKHYHKLRLDDLIRTHIRHFKIPEDIKDLVVDQLDSVFQQLANEIDKKLTQI